MTETAPKAEPSDPTLREITGEVVASLNTRSSREIKKECLRKYPDRLQEIELLFDLPKFFRYERELEELGKTGRLTQRHRELLTGLTEYAFTVTNHLVNNSEDPTYLEKFWDSLKEITEATGNGSSFKRYKAGWLGQTAAYHLLDRLNLHPALATPKQDAFKRIDICGKIPGQELPVAFQVKTSRKFVELELEGKRYDVYPTAEIVGGKLKIYDVPAEDQKFAVHAVNINLPHGSYNPITAVPTEKGIEEFNGQLRKLKRTLRDEGL